MSEHLLTPLPKVSIITPSYNQGRFIDASIWSVLTQDYPNIEYIIVDGDSKDETVEIIKKYQDRLAWWVSEKDKGHADALNKGFSHATGEILAWLNSDDIYFPGAVSEAVGFLLAHPEVGMVYGDANLIDDTGQTIGKFSSRQTDYKRMLEGSVHIPQATTFFRADLWRQVSPLDLSLFYSFDYDLWVRMAKLKEIRYVPRMWAHFRIHDKGKTVLNDDRCYPDMLRVRQREIGGWLSWLRLRYYARRLLYVWMPIRMRLWLRKMLTF
ncbi:MAG TPA: glycosyltransferase family 2 protein [Anaerolineaceae bacterium]|nr:glycosyltransferase family 2 protein [Anaerolineaceae bacterium]